MALEMYQDVILTVDLLEHGLCKGDLGTVVERHVVPGREEGYRRRVLRHDRTDRGRPYPSCAPIALANSCRFVRARGRSAAWVVNRDPKLTAKEIAVVLEQLRLEIAEWNELIAGFVGSLKDARHGTSDAPITQYSDFEHLEARGRKKRP